MKNKLLKNKAENLRKSGYSLREISDKIGISKSTASIWSSDIIISDSGKLRLQKIKEQAIQKTKDYKKEQKKQYFSEILQNCDVLIGKQTYSSKEFKIFLALLFWGEGSKKERRLTFTNSDPAMIKSFLYLLRQSYKVEDEKLRAILHLHSYHDKKKQLDFWSKITKIRKDKIIIYNKEHTGKRKNNEYEGCISIRYGDVRILDELFLIIERFKKFTFASVV
ncbi:MAG: hypothetical protein J7L15_04995 [Clostridiales bacterium]|nr:hypothetical protein [Clostridiales bacterium]